MPPFRTFVDDKVDIVEVGGELEDALTDEIDTDPLTDPLAFDHDYTALRKSVDREEEEPPRARSRRLDQVDFEDDDDDDDDNDEEEEEEDVGEITFVDINRLKANTAVSSPPPPPPPASATPLTVISATDPQCPKDERLKPGVERPGTTTTTSSTEDAESSSSSPSDGSDSGLGTDLLNVHAQPHTAHESSCGVDPQQQQEQSPHHPSYHSSSSSSSSAAALSVPVVSILKLRYDQLPAECRPSAPVPVLPPPPPPTPGVPVRSALKRASLEEQGSSSSNAASCEIKNKRPRRTVTFDNVTVYYFSRVQGFLCVPSVGGCTLGMERRHTYERSMTLHEHLAEQRRNHRHQLELLNPSCTRSQQQQQQQQSHLVHQSSSDDSDEEADVSDVDTEPLTLGFLRPVGTKQRRALLKAAGVRKIDAAEKDECRVIRLSREVCGCRCQGYCDPELCYCSVNGIKCQVDRPSFPCSCTGECCGNRTGRVEFNPVRVRTHYIHTVMRLELEQKQQQVDGEEEGEDTAQNVISSSSSSSRSGGSITGVLVDYSSRRLFEPSLSSATATTTSKSTTAISSSQQAVDLNSAVPTVMQLQTSNGDSNFGGGGGVDLYHNYGAVSGIYMDHHYHHPNTHHVEYRSPLPTSINSSCNNNPSVSSSSNVNDHSSSSSSSQFCNNILQILGIQSSSTPTKQSPTTATNSPLLPRRSYSGAVGDSAGTPSFLFSSKTKALSQTEHQLISRPFPIELGGVIKDSALSLVHSNGMTSGAAAAGADTTWLLNNNNNHISAESVQSTEEDVEDSRLCISK